MAADAVKRSARLALEMVAPQRFLAPLKAIELPCNFVRQGLEKMRDLGLKIGHAAVMNPIQAIRMAMKGIAKNEETMEPKLELKRGFTLDR